VAALSLSKVLIFRRFLKMNWLAAVSILFSASLNPHLLVAAKQTHAAKNENVPAKPLILVSIDGFMPKYFERNLTPNLALIGK
jgi:predicted AlkP superfamily pyrophosphatase or phosphodiesterase